MPKSAITVISALHYNIRAIVFCGMMYKRFPLGVARNGVGKQRG